MKRANKLMKTALLSTVVLANVFAGASAFAAEDTPATAPAVTAEGITATEAAATEAAPAAPAATVNAGATMFRIDEGTYVEIRDVYGNPVWVPAATEAAPALTQTAPLDLFGGTIFTVKSKNLDNK